MGILSGKLEEEGGISSVRRWRRRRKIARLEFLDRVNRCGSRVLLPSPYILTLAAISRIGEGTICEIHRTFCRECDKFGNVSFERFLPTRKNVRIVIWQRFGHEFFAPPRDTIHLSTSRVVVRESSRGCKNMPPGGKAWTLLLNSSHGAEHAGFQARSLTFNIFFAHIRTPPPRRVVHLFSLPPYDTTVFSPTLQARVCYMVL